MLSIKLRPEQTISEFIQLVDSWQRFNKTDYRYTIEFGDHPYYMIDPEDKHLHDWIKANFKTHKIHRKEDSV